MRLFSRVHRFLGVGLLTGLLLHLLVLVAAAGQVENAATGKVIFTNNVSANSNSWTITEIEAEVPSNATSGDVVVETDDGTSNGSPFLIGSSFTPDDSNEGLYWSQSTYGTLTQDTTWSENMLVIGDVTVPATVTLTISPGVTVFFDANSDSLSSGLWTDKSEIHVYGTLIANGTISDHIYFTSSQTQTAQIGDWGAIVMRKDSTESSMSYCLAHYAKKALYFYSSKEGEGDLTATVSNCTFTDNETGIAMWGRPGNPDGGTITVYPTITHNYVYSNVNYGIDIRATTGRGTSYNTSHLQNNTIGENDIGVAVRGGSWWLGHVDNLPTILNNTIYSNTSQGIYVEPLGSSDSSGSDTVVNPVIHNNLIETSRYNIHLYLDPLGTDGTQVLSPTIRYNTIRNGVDNIRIEQASPLWLTEVDSGEVGVTLLVSRTKGILTVKAEQGQQLLLSSTFSPTIDNNVLYGHSTYQVNNLTSVSIVAEDNYWGSTESAWDSGPAAGDTNGMVDTTPFLDTDDEPLLTRLAPGAAQVGDDVILHGANFGQ